MHYAESIEIEGGAAMTHEVQLKLAERVRKHIEQLRAWKLEVTQRRDEAQEPDVRQKLEELRCALSEHERKEIELYGKLLPAEMLTLH